MPEVVYTVIGRTAGANEGWRDTSQVEITATLDDIAGKTACIRPDRGE